MCSIEEAWAGQSFGDHLVKSQADIHRKYMPITDDALERNNSFSVNSNEPQPREGTRGLNTKMMREGQTQSGSNNQNQVVGQLGFYQPRVSSSTNGSNMEINYSSNMPERSNYGGLEPRPSYMSIYDNADSNSMQFPVPSSKEQFNDISQAYSVSDTLNNFMTNGQTRNSNNNLLLEEDTNQDIKILQSKLNNINSNNSSNGNNSNKNNSNNSNNSSYDVNSPEYMQIRQVLQDIIIRLDKLDNACNHNTTRNMYDMILYILVGMLISFIIYSIFTK